ncbi:hypothetical protein M595_2869 [Lyngbya aestuarii BL J]|uniref:Uncharacterized protein n=1 Tax=Lyngbya aestuarii BL J TaxID=1348334 RepID=U7QH14_9CYAN|nr:hypothetical protein M595_2869 [Lyngbya aestuarii BL J]
MLGFLGSTQPTRKSDRLNGVTACAYAIAICSIIVLNRVCCVIDTNICINLKPFIGIIKKKHYQTAESIATVSQQQLEIKQELLE